MNPGLSKALFCWTLKRIAGTSIQPNREKEVAHAVSDSHLGAASGCLREVSQVEGVVRPDAAQVQTNETGSGDQALLVWAACWPRWCGTRPPWELQKG